MSVVDPRTASGPARLLARILTGMARRRMEIVISPPTGAFALWSASARPAGQTIGKNGVWSARTTIAGLDMDYQVETESLERLLAELVEMVGAVGPLAGGAIPLAAITLEGLLEDLRLAGRQIVLCPPTGDDADHDQGMAELLGMVGTQTSEYLA